MKIIKPSYEILYPIDGKAILEKIELCARVSHKSEGNITPTSAQRLVKRLIEIGDESVLEHCSITVRFICDRGVSHELVRHRIAAYTQESTRYCNYLKDGFGNELTFIQPCFLNNMTGKRPFFVDDITGKTFRDDIVFSPIDIAWYDAMLHAETFYFDMLKAGAKPEEARSVLPNSLKTEVICTANLREWRHILKLRCDKRAHPQCRELMVPLLHELQSKVPIVFDDIKADEKCQ